MKTVNQNNRRQLNSKRRINQNNRRQLNSKNRRPLNQNEDQ